jgi:ribosomal protein L29
MDTKELRQKSDKELSELTASLREQIRAMRFDIAADALKDVRDMREARKTLARALTIVGERKQAAKVAGSVKQVTANQ